MATTRPNRSIADFKGKLVGGGARPNLFEVTIPALPDGIAWDGDTFRYMFEDEDVINFYSRLINEVNDCKIILYNFEKLSGYKFCSDCVEKLVDKDLEST